MVAFDRAEYEWHDDADPADATLAFLASVDHDESGARLARLELVDGDETPVGDALVTAVDLPGWDGEAAAGTSVFHVTVVDDAITSVEYDPELSQEYHERLLDQIERLTDEE